MRSVRHAGRPIQYQFPIASLTSAANGHALARIRSDYMCETHRIATLNNLQSGVSVCTPRPRVDDDGNATNSGALPASEAEPEGPAPLVPDRTTINRSSRIFSTRIAVTVPKVKSGRSNGVGLPTTTATRRSACRFRSTACRTCSGVTVWMPRR